MESNYSMKAAKHRFAELASLASSAAKSEGDTQESTAQQCVLLAMQAASFLAKAETQRRHEFALLAREGITQDTQYEGKKRVLFAWSLDHHERGAEIYPDAHTNGETFCLKITERTNPSRHTDDTFKGHGWIFEDAVYAGKKWANEGEEPINPLHVVKNIMDR